MSYIRRILDHRLGDNVDEEAYDGLCYDVINVRYVEVQGEGAPSNDIYCHGVATKQRGQFISMPSRDSIGANRVTLLVFATK